MLMVEQVSRIKAIRPSAITMVYRNTVKALSWFSHVREKLLDPAYASWFLRFGVTNPQTPACDTAYAVPLCSNLYHDQMQTPQFSTIDDGQNGTCYAPCDCGGVPTGEYLWDLRNSSAREYILENILGPTALGNANITGLYLDDYWVNVQEAINPEGNQPLWGYCSHSPIGGPSEIHWKCVDDMQLTQTDVNDLTTAWQLSFSTFFDVMDDAGALAYSSFNFISTPNAAIMNSNLANLCADGVNSAIYISMLMLLFTTEPECCPVNRNTTLLQFSQDLVYFQLVRGPWAWLGYGYEFCAAKYEMPAELFLNYGSPMGTCTTTAPGVYAREFEHSTAVFDTNTYKGEIIMKAGA